MNLQYRSGASWVNLYTEAEFDFEGPLYVSLYITCEGSAGCVRFTNFIVNVPENAYPTSGTFESGAYDCGRVPTWDTLDWTATTPSGTDVKFQLASSSSPDGPFNFSGPTGPASYYTTPGTAIPSTGSGAITERFLRYQATLTGDGTE